VSDERYVETQNGLRQRNQELGGRKENDALFFSPRGGKGVLEELLRRRMATRNILKSDAKITGKAR